MGFVNQFACDICGHELKLYGLDGGRGLHESFQSCHCGQCEDVVDVAREYFNTEGMKSSKDKLNQCPRCHGTNVLSWTLPYICPRCGTPMRRDVVGLWD